MTTESSIGPTGLAVDGEVEDYIVTISQPACSLIVTNTDDSGPGSLREAINCANATSGADRITFAIETSDAGFNAATNSWTIEVDQPLPAITDTVEIDGYSQAGAAVNINPFQQGSNAVLTIEISAGSSEAQSAPALLLQADGNTIQGLTINDFFESAPAIRIESDNNIIAGNFLGTDVTGTRTRSNAAGIVIADGAENQIGGRSAAQRNVISGSLGSGASDGAGIEISGQGATGNRVEGNYIGSNADGDAELGNEIGIEIVDAANNTIGSLGAGNLISGNEFAGVRIRGAAATGNELVDNLIGTDATGTLVLGNSGAGVEVIAANNFIGQPGTFDGNVIAANFGAGVRLTGSGNTVAGNAIGTNFSGTIDLGNRGAGVYVDGSDNLIGGNTIAFNGTALSSTGVDVIGGTGNQISTNNIYSNHGLGIDLGVDGVTPNDSGDSDMGPNGLLNFPLLESATVEDGNLVVSGFARPGSEIEFFMADPDPTGFGEGRTYLGTRTEGSTDDSDAATGSYGPDQVNGLDQGTDTTNRFSFTIPLAGLPATVAIGDVLTATATDAGGNTSEFSGNVTLTTTGAAIVATKTDSLAEDRNNDGMVNPGDTIQYDVQIENLGDEDALNVQFTDAVDANTMLLPDSVTVTPLALDDSYAVVPDMSITVDAAGGLLANDFDIDGGVPGTNTGLTVVVGSVRRVDGVSDVAGTFTPNPDGSFTYTPAIGARGTEVFAYNILDADGLAAVVDGFVTFNVDSNIWFVDNSRTTSGDGSLSNPFNSFAEVNGVGGVGDLDQPGDIIFVFEGNAPYDQSVQLEENQQLIGEGNGLTILGTELVPAGNRPTLTQNNASAGINGEAIRLANSNTIAGLDIIGSVGTGLEGDQISGGSVTKVRIAGAGTVGVDLQQSSGTFTLSGVDIVDPAETALVVQGGTANVEFGEAAVSTIQTSAGSVLQAGQGHTGTITFKANSTIAATGGSGLQFVDADGTYIFNGGITLDGTSNGAGTGIDIISDSAGTFTFTGTFSAPIEIVNDQGTAIQMENSPGTATFEFVDINQSVGAGIRADNSGTLNVLNVDIDNTSGDGIHSTNTNLSVNFAAIGIDAAIGDDGIEVVNSDGINRTASILNNNIFPLGASPGIANRGIFVNSSGTGTLIADVRFNQISSTNQCLLTTDGGTAGSLVLDLQNSTLTRETAGFTEEHIGSGLDSTIIRSWTAPNQVTGFTGGGISFNRVTFDASGSALTGAQVVLGGNGELDIGSASGRVQGDGLSLMATSGSLSIPKLNIFTNDGIGLHADTTGTPFAFEANGGTIDALGGEGINATNFTRAAISNTQVTGGDGLSAVEVVLNEDGLASSITSLNNQWTARSGAADGVVIGTASTAKLCLHAVGNENLGSNGGFGLVLNQADSSVLAITQSDFLEFAADNPLTLSLNPIGTVTFDCMIPEVTQLQGAVNATASPVGISAENSTAGEGEISPSMPLLIGTLPVGKAIQIVFQATINDPFPSGVTQVSNQGTVSGSNFVDVVTDDPETLPPNDPTITPIGVAVPMADLSIDKRVDNMAPRQGDPITFTVTLSNAGPDEATNIQVADAIPAGLSDVEVMPGGGSTYIAGTWSISSLAANASITLTIAGRTDSTSAISNTAEVIAVDQSDPDSTPNNNDAEEDDQDSATATPATAAADLSLTKSVNHSRPNVGQEVVFTIAVNNAGPDDASGVDVTDLLPAGLMFLRSTESAGTYDGGTGVWTVGALPIDQTETLTVTAMVTASSMTRNVAEVTASDQPDPDSTPGNGVPDEDDQASAIVTPQVADLSLVKTVDDTSANLGEEVTFTIAVNNAGPDAATGLTVTDQLPAGLQFIRATGPGSYDDATGAWTVGSIAAGATVTLDIVATVTSDEPVTNVAQVATSDQFDPDSAPGNDVRTEDDQFSVSVGACLTGGPLTIGMNRLVYSCVTPGGFAAFVMGTQAGSHLFAEWGATVDIADPSVPAIGVGNIDGVATVLVEMSGDDLNQELIFQAFEMLPNRKLSNTLTLQTSDNLVGLPLRAAEVGAGGAALSANALPALTAAAIARWEATGVSVPDSHSLRSLLVRIGDLPGDQLAASHGHFILLDSTAAGNGWFVDTTPDDHAEFSGDGSDALLGTVPAGRDHIDALTVLMHEMGHVLGQDDLSDESTSDLMSRTLPLGVRRLPTSIYDPLDANRDGKVSALDALVIINGLAREQATGETLTAGLDQVMRGYDVNQDGRVSALDALHVINDLGRTVLGTTAEAEQYATSVALMPDGASLYSSGKSDSLDDDLLEMLADDSLNAKLIESEF